MLHLDAEALYAGLKRGVRAMLADLTADAGAEASLVGIWRGGAWIAERLHQDLHLPGRHGVISSALHRDDYASRGMAGGEEGDATDLPFSIDGRHIVLVDDVLYTGRTIRAVVNELFDFGRPASVRLAVLVDRDGRQLPIEPGYAAVRIVLAPTQQLRLARAPSGMFQFDLRDGAPGMPADARRTA